MNDEQERTEETPSRTGEDESERQAVPAENLREIDSSEATKHDVVFQREPNEPITKENEQEESR